MRSPDRIIKRNRTVPDARSTRERILAQAETLFALHTFSGTAVDAVAQAARVSKRMIYHYFEDKAGLYGAVLRSAHRRWTTFEYFKTAPKDPLEFIDGFIVWSFEAYKRDPTFVRLVVGENLHEGRYFEIASPSPFTRLLITTFTEVVQRGKIQEQIAEDVDAVHLLADIIGLCFFHFSNAYTMSRTLETDLRGPDGMEQRLAHIRNLIRRSITRTETVTTARPAGTMPAAAQGRHFDDGELQDARGASERAVPVPAAHRKRGSHPPVSHRGRSVRGRDADA